MTRNWQKINWWTRKTRLLNHISCIRNVKRCLDFLTHLSNFLWTFFSVNREQWTYLERNREKQMKTWHLQNIFDRAAAVTVRKLLFENGLQTYKLILLSLWLMQSMNISFLQGLAFIGVSSDTSCLEVLFSIPTV